MKNDVNKTFLKGIVFVLVCLQLAACHSEKKHPQGIEHVVVIGIDGMSVQGLLEAETPCMDSLLQNGAFNYKVRSVLPTVSAPNWNAMLCGAGPDATGVIDNDWERGIDKFPPVACSENKVFPNIFSVIRDQKPNAETGCFSHWGYLVKTMLEVECMNQYEACKSSRETAQKTAQYILEKKPDFVFIQLDEVDHAGHSKGYMSAEYLKTIRETDDDVRIIVDAVKNAGISENTMIMIVPDHGGIFYGHGGNRYEELTTPIIYSGKGIKNGYQIKQQIYRYDVAADVAFALGLKIPQVWVGRPVKAAFKGFNEPDNLDEGIEILPPPVFVSNEVKTVYGGLYVDTLAEVKIKMPVGVDGEIRYTTDGTLPTRESELYTGPFFLDKSALVKVKIFGENGAESPMVMSQFRIAQSKKGNGVNYSFYHLADETKMPSFSSKTPVGKGVCFEVGLNSRDVSELKQQYKTDFGMCFTGWLEIDTDADYTFRIWADGGYRLFIDSLLVTGNENLNGSNSAGSIRLTKGFHPYKIEYFTREKSGSLDVYYETPEMPIRFLPGDKLFRDLKKRSEK